MNDSRETNWHIYAIVFAITIFIFGSAYLLSNFFYQQRLSDVRAVEQSLSMNVLATEVDYALLADTICDAESSVLSEELSNLADKLSYMEDTGEDKDRVAELKKNYTLLLVKDYLLSKEKGVKCGIRPPTILYFYSNTGSCADCKRQGYVLTGLQQDIPELRIYAFDYNLDLSVVRTLRSIYRLSGELPALVIDRVPYYGFHDRESILSIFPALHSSLAQGSSTPATTTKTEK
jgi:hypothetical protein